VSTIGYCNPVDKTGYQFIRLAGSYSGKAFDVVKNMSCKIKGGHGRQIPKLGTKAVLGGS
jgi:hypothetical protein